MKRTTLWIGLGLLLFSSCSNLTETQLQYIDYVNPFVGTGGHGHTFPGPVAPHGMIQPRYPYIRVGCLLGISLFRQHDKRILSYPSERYGLWRLRRRSVNAHRRKTKLSLLGRRLPTNRLCLTVLALQRSGKTGILFGRTRSLQRDSRTNGDTSGGPAPLSFPRK